VTAMFVAVSGSVGHRTAVAMFVDAGFALAGLLATLVVPPGPPRSPAAAASPVPPPRRRDTPLSSNSPGSVFRSRRSALSQVARAFRILWTELDADETGPVPEPSLSR